MRFQRAVGPGSEARLSNILKHFLSFCIDTGECCPKEPTVLPNKKLCEVLGFNPDNGNFLFFLEKCFVCVFQEFCWEVISTQKDFTV